MLTLTMQPFTWYHCVIVHAFLKAFSIISHHLPLMARLPHIGNRNTINNCKSSCVSSVKCLKDTGYLILLICMMLTN